MFEKEAAVETRPYIVAERRQTIADGVERRSKIVAVEDGRPLIVGVRQMMQKTAAVGRMRLVLQQTAALAAAVRQSTPVCLQLVVQL